MGTTTGIAFLSVVSTNANILDISSTTASILRILNNGKVGISSSTPNYQLSVGGTVAMPGLSTSAGTQSGVVCVSAAGELINDSVACIASARRFKKNIFPLESGLKEVMALKPVSFFYTDKFNEGFKNDPNYNGEQVGFIAEDVQKVDPRLTVVETSGKDKGKLHSVRYENITALLALAIQDQQKEINTLKGVARSAEENWQWIAIAVLFLWNMKQGLKIKKLIKR
jgi:hypothetical protein